MQRLDRILVPLDGAKASEAIVPYVAGLAERVMAGLVLFRAADSPAGRAAANDYLESVAARLRASGAGVATHASADPGSAAPSAAIADAVRRYNADIIAMTGHGHTTGRKDLIGSTAHMVLQSCTVPVLVLRTTDVAWAQPSAIVVGLDGSDRGQIALGPAVRLATLLNCELALVRAAGPPAPLGGAARYFGTVDNHAGNYLANIKGSLASSGLRITTHVGRRPAEQELLAAASARPGAIVVLSTSGLSGAPGVLGSTPDRVVRSQACPVLAVPVF